MEKKIIPVVFATDENYVVPTYVAAFSLLRKASKNVFFEIYVMIPESMTERGRNILKSLQLSNNCSISFLNMKDAFNDVKMLISYITPATYYRLLLPQLLPQHDRCIYLDSDIIINHDIEDFYNLIDSSNYLVGVVAANPPLASFTEMARKKHAELLNVASVENYINAGVLVLNLEKMRSDDLGAKFIDLISKGFPFQDQDILNAVCYGRIIFADRKYNVCPLNKLKSENVSLPHETVKMIKEAYDDPTIVHYAMPQKPWLSHSFPMASYWWNSYENIDKAFREEFLDSFIKHNRIKFYKIKIKHSKLFMNLWSWIKRIKNCK